MISYFWKYLREDRRKLWLCLVSLLITATLPAAMALVPVLLNSTWRPDKIHQLWLGLAGLFVLNLLFTVPQFLLTYFAAQVSQNFGRRVRAAIFQKIGNLPTLSMNLQSVGSLAYRSTSDVMRIQEFLMPTLPQTLSNAAQLLFLVVALFFLGPGFGLALLLLVPVIWFFVGRLNNRLQHFARMGQRQSENVMTRFIEGVGGYRDLVAAGRFNDAATAFDDRLDEFRKTQITTSIINAWSSMAPILGFTLYLFAYYFVKTTNSAAVGDMVYIGKVISFTTILGMLQGPAMEITRFFTEAALSAPSFFEVRKLLEAPEVPDISGGRKPAQAGIELDGLSFSYEPGAPPVLDNISFKIEPGSFTAIVGQTGTGKSTLFYLLLRLLEPSAGQIRLAGIPLREISLVDLREFIGFIPQSPFIFDATIQDNLCMGVPRDHFEEERIQEAIRMARLEKLVASRMQAGGLEAPVGPGGATLSGGERQRIALGRIFLRDPQIIVCDEYTANIDNATARLIQEALAKVFAGKTRLVITHQLYTVRDADNILVLDQGRIADSGSHDQLVNKPGLYREMWEVQRLS
jgi:ATP-binding cassette subfamily B protein